MLTMDLHSKEVQGFYGSGCPVDNLRASPFLIQYIQDRVSVPRYSPVYSSVFLLRSYHWKLVS